MSGSGAAKVKLAYARLFSDNPQNGDAAIVLADLRLATFGTQSIAGWIKATGTAQGYEASCHEFNGKRALFERVASFAGLTEAQMLELERIARVGRAEE